MSELRFDELRGERIAYAINRQDRTFLPAADRCPLCPTGDPTRPTEIPVRAFEIAVFENRFPAFEPASGGGGDRPRLGAGRTPPSSAGAAASGEDGTPTSGGGGAAEVVVYTDEHRGSLASLPAERAEALMWVWRHRYRELGSRPDVAYVFIFENRGVEVGVTLRHPHGQIYGYPFVPPVAALERAAGERLGGCASCTLLRRELDDGRRILLENDAVVAYVPYAARWSYEAHVVLREHRPSLLECEPLELRLLAAALQALLRGYDALFERPFPYVMAVHQAPTDGSGGGHLRVELYPPLRTAGKLKYLAGSEQGAGVFIADTIPEQAAAALRKAICRAT